MWFVVAGIELVRRHVPDSSLGLGHQKGYFFVVFGASVFCGSLRCWLLLQQLLHCWPCFLHCCSLSLLSGAQRCQFLQTRNFAEFEVSIGTCRTVNFCTVHACRPLMGGKIGQNLRPATVWNCSLVLEFEPKPLRLLTANWVLDRSAWTIIT